MHKTIREYTIEAQNKCFAILFIGFFIATAIWMCAPAKAGIHGGADAAWTLPEEPSTFFDGMTLSECARSMYTATEHPELDEAVYKAFDAYETNAEQDSYLIVYRGTYEECFVFRDYLNTNYGYTYDIHAAVGEIHGKEGGYCVLYKDTLNADEKIAAYIREANLAKAAADAVKADTADKTINNIIAWVKQNAKYYYDEDDHDGYIAHYYGLYHGSEVLCEGYAMGVYQLCAMNGIKASIENVIADGVNHAMNTVTFSDGATRFVDATLLNPVSDELPKGYTYQAIR